MGWVRCEGPVLAFRHFEPMVVQIAGQERMPKLKCKTLLIGLAAAMLSAGAAFAEAKPDDRSYLPPQAKEPGEQAVPQVNDRLRSARYRKPRQPARSHRAYHPEHRSYAHHRDHR